ncbi:MAG: hypothetical protein HYX25_11060 [Candidatus Solibacter usitatus]|nr:hypothetical protein [Candidatus Solibacter usitatus]
MKITRRSLAITALAPAAAALSQATSQAQAPAAGEDLNALAHSLLRANSEILTKAAIPIATEPAFQFKA